MPISEIITGNDITSEAVSVEIVSDVVIGGDAAGLVYLQVQLPQTGEWVNLTNQSGAYTIMTPDVTLRYRFKAVNLKNSVEVFFGP